MNDIIISDTSCLILFDKINETILLRELYGTIYITTEIAEEYGKVLPEWINILSIKSKHKKKQLENYVDKGEASAIALALEIPNGLLLIDDKKGRQLAKRLGISISGTLGTILKAKKNGLIKSVKPYIDKLIEINYWISPSLIKQILDKEKEL
jgi:predicted nucleic acid-binding protein